MCGSMCGATAGGACVKVMLAQEGQHQFGDTLRVLDGRGVTGPGYEAHLVRVSPELLEHLAVVAYGRQHVVLAYSNE